ncbi:MAG: rhomboid family intramembrane serine protease [Deltaproteobacteria bacterium]|nr:rhomboid family intramembrane serine protease [Deltaproteobacteria bacterium]
MYYELALISVAIAGGYWGWFFVRRDSLQLYGGMLLAAALLSVLGLLGRREDIESLGIPGAIGVGAGTCLLVVGPFVRGMARRAAAAERFGIADRLLRIADVLAPGSGVSDERALLGAMKEINGGNIDATVEALQHARSRAPHEAKLAIDERIAMLYLAAYRWEDAIAHAEAHLFGAMAPHEAGPHVALRRALGVAPPVWVELLGAYGYQGNLDQAARMLARLEEVCEGREDAGLWLHRGRMMFLALAGQPDAVRPLVEPRRSRHMTSAARTYWVAVAHERHGDAAVAEAQYTKARKGSRGRPRVLIDQALARLRAHASPPALGDDAQQVMARVAAAPVPEVAERVRSRGPRATRILAASLVVPAIAIAVLIGSSSDVGVLLRAGALVRGLAAAEPWRLVSCIFVHVGGVHLLVNVMGLWFLGRLAEDFFGPWRLVAIFAVAGLAGSAASYFASPAGISAGASGAIFGVLGALFVELTLQRRRHRAAWSRGIWGSLALVTVAQIAIGFFYPVTDQWAHGGGLLAGAILGVVLSPSRRAFELPAKVVAIAFALVVAGATVMVARTSVADSLWRGPLVEHTVNHVTVRAPTSWLAGKAELTDPGDLVELDLERTGAPLDQMVAIGLAHAKQLGFSESQPANDRMLALPGWTALELDLVATDALESRQHFRMVVATQGGVTVTLYVPTSLLREAPSVFEALVASAH